MQDHGSGRTEVAGRFPTETEGLPEARRPEVVPLGEGDELELEIAPVRKRIGNAVVRMLAYNGSIPGPTLEVPRGATVTVHVTNRGDLDATVHWHGLRLENRYDGTHDTQAPIPVGETFTYQVHCPDEGAYWYHPHIREDYGQELGLYGNILVVPTEPGYWPAANRELLLTLDDILIEDGAVAAFGEETTHVAMGRFGNVMLVAGERTSSAGEAGRGRPLLPHQHREHAGLQRGPAPSTHEARRRRQWALRARGARGGGAPGPLRARRRGRPVRRAGRGDARAPDAGALLPPCLDCHIRRAGGSDSRGAVRGAADQRRHVGSPRATCSAPRRPAGQDARLRRRDGDGRARGLGRVRMPDASRGRERRARPLPRVRDEAARGRGELQLPDAPGSRQQHARPLPEMRDEADARGVRRTPGARGAPRARGAPPRTTSTTMENRIRITLPVTRTTRLRGSSGRTTWSR